MVYIMKLKILALWLVSLISLFMTSCSQVTDAPAEELRAASWEEKTKDDVTLSLCFKNDDAILWIKDNKNNKKYKISGTTIVTNREIHITDIETLSCYDFTYILYGDRVELIYNNKKIEMSKVN